MFLLQLFDFIFFLRKNDQHEIVRSGAFLIGPRFEPVHRLNDPKGIN